MPKKPAISVVMPIYNAERYLKQALNSVLNQTLTELEIVCVNDGSKDSSLEILRDYASRDNRIKVIDKPNGGYGHAMNVGLNNATGDYIGILEPDDYIKPDMYATLYAAASKNDLDFVRSNYSRLTTDESGNEHLQEVKITEKPKYYIGIQNPQSNLDLFNVRMENWTGIYKRSFIECHGIKFNESPGAAFQDNGFWFQTYCHATRIMLIDQPFYCYRVDNAASSINQTDKVFVMLDEYKWIENWLRSDPELEKKFIGIFQYKKVHNCEFALSRLAESYKPMFLERYASEYKIAFEAGEIDESLFWPDELARLKLIVENPQDACQVVNKHNQNAIEVDVARQQGKLALFRHYARTEGIGSACRRAIKSIKK